MSLSPENFSHSIGLLDFGVSLVLDPKMNVPNLVTSLNLKLIFEWCAVKHTCLKILDHMLDTCQPNNQLRGEGRSI